MDSPVVVVPHTAHAGPHDEVGVVAIVSVFNKQLIKFEGSTAYRDASEHESRSLRRYQGLTISKTTWQRMSDKIGVGSRSIGC